MSMPVSFLDAPTLMGSWPNTLGNLPGILPKTVLNKARIFGMKKETDAGFDVAGKAFYLYRDALPAIQITFGVGSPNLTLNQVITAINTATTPTVVAYRDNGFLKLESQTSGYGSYLKVEHDPLPGNSSVLSNLGLFSGIESSAGDLSSPVTLDNARQVVAPHQLSFCEGESFSASTFNRSAFQLAVNSDLHQGLLSRKRQAKIVELEVLNPGAGFTLNDSVYTGSVLAPTSAQLEEVVSVMDTTGLEIVIDVETELASGIALEFFYDSDQNSQYVTGPTGTFSSDDEKDPVFIKSSLLPSLADVPLKILRVDPANIGSTTTAYVLNVDPATGLRVPIGTNSVHVAVLGSKVRVEPKHVEVTGLWTSSSKTTRVEKTNFNKVDPPVSITRLELNNRVVSSGATFSSSGVIPGDLVTIAGHSISTPYSNNGSYKVSSVISDEVLELVTEDFGPVFLNPEGNLGTIKVQTDGDFYLNPFVSLSPPLPSGTYKFVYRKKSNLKEILDGVELLTEPPSSYRQSNDALLEKVLMGVLGPSVNSFYEYLHNDHRSNLEGLEYQLDAEHYRNGKHKTVRADLLTVGDPDFRLELVADPNPPYLPDPTIFGSYSRNLYTRYNRTGLASTDYITNYINNTLASLLSIAGLRVVGGITVGFTNVTPTANTVLVGQSNFGLNYNSGNPKVQFEGILSELAYDRTTKYCTFTADSSNRFTSSPLGFGINTGIPQYTLDVFKGTGACSMAIRTSDIYQGFHITRNIGVDGITSLFNFGAGALEITTYDGDISVGSFTNTKNIYLKGKTSIGDFTPLSRLHVQDASRSPGTGYIGSLMISPDSGVTKRLIFGVDTSSGTMVSWVQSIELTPATPRNLLIQPLGGDVGVGCSPINPLGVAYKYLAVGDDGFGLRGHSNNPAVIFSAGAALSYNRTLGEYSFKGFGSLDSFRLVTNGGTNIFLNGNGNNVTIRMDKTLGTSWGDIGIDGNNDLSLQASGAIKLKNWFINENGVFIPTNFWPTGLPALTQPGDIVCRKLWCNEWVLFDFILEKWSTGTTNKTVIPEGVVYTERLNLDDADAYVRSSFKLPSIGIADDGSMSGKMYGLLASLEEAYTYIFELNYRIKALEALKS
jgi:hypothetical protein